MKFVNFCIHSVTRFKFPNARFGRKLASDCKGHIMRTGQTDLFIPNQTDMPHAVLHALNQFRPGTRAPDLDDLNQGSAWVRYTDQDITVPHQRFAAE
jgi:hypothetical protein